MIAALVLFVAHQGATITFESTAITVQGFCKELSRQTGKKYVAWDALQGDFIAVHLDAAPIDEVLKQLQFVERAKLDFDGTNNNLRPDIAVRTKLKADWMADRIDAIKYVQNHVRKQVRDKPLDDPQAKEIATTISALLAREKAQREAQNDSASSQTYQQVQDQLVRFPVGNVMLKMFLAIPAEEIAAVGVDEIGVWSTAPTQVEHSCHLDSNLILQEFADDQATWSDASTKYLSGETSQFIKQSNPTISKPTAVLRLEMLPGNFSVDMLRLTGFDATGKKSFEVMQIFGDEPRQSTAPVVLPSDLGPVTVSVPAQAERLIRLWGSVPPETEMATWASDSTLAEMYFNPEKHDPVGETFGRVMVEVAKARKEQMISAEPADFALRFPVDVIVKGRLTDRALAEAFLEDGNKFRRVHYENDKTLITARPGLIEVETEREFDRPALGKLLRAARDTRTVTLMDAAKYAAGPGDRMAYRSLRLLPFLAPDVSGLELLHADGWELKAFLGRLDDAQIATAQQPGGLALTGCTPFQLECLTREFQLKRFAWHNQTDVWHSYPTDGLPNGLPGGGVLHLSVDSGTAIRAKMKIEGGYAQDAYGSVSEIAEYLNGIGPVVPDSNFRLAGLIPQISQSYVFNFVFPEDVTTTEKLNDYRPAAKEARAPEELEEPLRSQLATAMQKLRKN